MINNDDDDLTTRTHFLPHFCTVFSSILQPTGDMGDVVSGRFVGPVVPDSRMKFGDPHLNCSREIPSEAVRYSIFDRFVNLDNCQLEIVSMLN